MKFYPNIIAPYVNNNKVKFHEDSTENNGFRQPWFDKLKLAGNPHLRQPTAAVPALPRDGGFYSQYGDQQHSVWYRLLLQLIG